MERLISFFGLFALLGLTWLMSSHKTRISLRIVLGGLGLQFLLAVLVLWTAPGRWLFEVFGAAFEQMLLFVEEGASFVFGPRFKDFMVAFYVLPTIIVFSSLSAVLYYLGIMQRVVAVLARVMQWTLGVSGAESLSAAANIFVGQTEAPLMVRPYIEGMTRSELCAVMVGGFATISGGLLATYTAMGAKATHLLAASVISAPAALMIAKILEPETGQPQTKGKVKVHVERPGVNIIEAAAIGAGDGLRLALNVAAMLIAFIALIAMADAILGGLGSLVGQEWSLGKAFGFAFWPLAWLMGIETADCARAGELLGLKMVVNEFVAYLQLGEWIKEGSQVKLSERSVTILTYALCGFSNFGAIGIQLGGIGGMAPTRRSELAQLGLRAMLGGAIACCMTGCVAGMLL